MMTERNRKKLLARFCCAKMSFISLSILPATADATHRSDGNRPSASANRWQVRANARMQKESGHGGQGRDPQYDLE
jgi:hypothetical protein